MILAGQLDLWGKDGEHKKMKIIKALKKILTMYAYTCVFKYN